PAIGQGGDEPMALALRQGRSAGDFDQPAAVAREFVEDALQAPFGRAVESIGGVAPRAPERAAREPDKHAGTPRVGGLALDAEEDFGDTHGGEVTSNTGRASLAGARSWSCRGSG